MKENWIYFEEDNSDLYQNLLAPYNKPPVSLLKDYECRSFNSEVENYEELKEIIEVKLRDIGIKATLVSATKEFMLTSCLVKAEDESSLEKLFCAQNDLQRLFETELPVVLKRLNSESDYLYIRVPNKERSLIGVKELMASEEYGKARENVPIAFGKTMDGKALIKDLATMRNIVIAGQSGDDVPICFNVIMENILVGYSPEEVKLIIIDPKDSESNLYSGMPHMLLNEPLSDPEEILFILKWIKKEAENRILSLGDSGHYDFNEYNENTKKKFPRIVVMIKRTNLLLKNVKIKRMLEKLSDLLSRLTKGSGIHLILLTQNPISGTTRKINESFKTKIIFSVGHVLDSQSVLRNNRARYLFGNGDMLFKIERKTIRAQCAYAEESEIKEIVNYIKKNNEYSFKKEKIKKIRGIFDKPDLYWKILKICVDFQYVSYPYIVDNVDTDHFTAMDILDKLTKDGYLSKEKKEGTIKRNVLISRKKFKNEWRKRFGPYEYDDELVRAGFIDAALKKDAGFDDDDFDYWRR